jgi:hypothetical protein
MTSLPGAMPQCATADEKNICLINNRPLRGTREDYMVEKPLSDHKAPPLANFAIKVVSDVQYPGKSLGSSPCVNA